MLARMRYSRMTDLYLAHKECFEDHSADSCESYRAYRQEWIDEGIDPDSVVREVARNVAG